MRQPSPIPVHEPSDVDLAARVAQRDRAAFETLYDRYAGKALGLIVRILGDRPLAEDVLQEAFWRVWQRAVTYDPARASFASWLFSIVHHCAIDELRKQRSRGLPVEIDGPEGEAHEIAARLREPIGTVHTRARLGLSKLRDLLAPLQSNLP